MLIALKLLDVWKSTFCTDADIDMFSITARWEQIIFSPSVSGEHMAGKFKSEYNTWNCLKMAALETNQRIPVLPKNLRGYKTKEVHEEKVAFKGKALTICI